MALPRHCHLSRLDKPGRWIGQIDCPLTSDRPSRSFTHEPSRPRIRDRGRRPWPFWPRGRGLQRESADLERSNPQTRGRTRSAPVRPRRARRPRQRQGGDRRGAGARDARRSGRCNRRRRRGARSLCWRTAARRHHDGRRPVADADAAAFSIEQTKAEFHLKLKDLTAQRRLTYVARRRRPAEMAVIGDRDHIFEVPQVHSFKDWRRQSLVKRQSIGPIALTSLSRPSEMAVTRKRHARRLSSFSIKPGFRQQDAEHYWRKA